ncbi:hypothetical protein Lupro_06180 [Lutibacter profundi]|uniref:Glycosyl transferase family 1 domain-containing protein n=1 Tax=Lutibacter profundi TaxID=1622118 RepID=A0A109RND8_9FLAO|nr:glycosyltransferase [Lutibacter profundi]AMC10854.1 hypothetical protein Lupro_06180 [Lutibacter profundi]
MKKRICFVVSSILTTRFFLEHHIKVLAKEYDIYLVGNFSEEDKQSIKHFHLKEIKSIRIERKISIIKDIQSVISLANYINIMQFEAVHSLAPKAGLVSALAGKISKTPNRIHIFTGQVWYTKTGVFRYLLKLFDKLIVTLNTEVLVDSNSQRDFLIKEGVVTKLNSSVLGKGSISGVDTSRFFQNLTIRKQLRNEFKIDDEVIVFLFMGRIKKDKGIIDLANSFKSLLATNKKIFLLVVGYDEGNCINDVSKIIANKEHFMYYGGTTNPERLMQAGDVFCLPSYREGFGTSIIEASSCKLGVICSDTYGLRDTIINNETGLRHKVGDVIELTEKMKLLATDINLIRTFGEKGLEYVTKNFTANYVSNEWLKFYKNLLK